VRLFRSVLRPVVHTARATSLFPRAAAFESNVTEPVLDGVLEPMSRSIASFLSWSRVLQRGSIQAYLFYVFVALVGMLVWVAL